VRPFNNGRTSKADSYFWKIHRKLNAHYRPLTATEDCYTTVSKLALADSGTYTIFTANQFSRSLRIHIQDAFAK